MAYEMRQNKATGEWVIFATSRSQRPYDFARHEKAPAPPGMDRNCPFCPGNETMIPPVLLEMTHPGSRKWQTRVIENKYPVLTQGGDNGRHASGIYMFMSGHGRHEVIIESPVHNQTIATMPVDDVVIVLETYYQRYVSLLMDNRNVTAFLFRNHGALAGTSLIHPHSQLVVMGIVPRYIRWREEEAQHYYDNSGRCVFCDIAEYELNDRRRVILENDAFLAFVPYAAEVPFEIWILPKKHQPGFWACAPEERKLLAPILRESLFLLHSRLNDPAFNYMFNSIAHYETDEPHLHWYVQIQPRLTSRAGFEIGSGIMINPVFPEDNADFLK